MDDFPGLDGGGAVRMGMVQSEDDVSRPDLAYKSCKGINVKSVDSLCVRLLCTISRLREICPVTHCPIPCLDNPASTRSMRAGTLFCGRQLSIRRRRHNFKASQPDHFAPVSSGYLKCDRVYSAG